MSKLPKCAKCDTNGCFYLGTSAAHVPLCPHHFWKHCQDEEMMESIMSENTELTMLRQFYENWVTMHSIKSDALHTRKKQQAAQVLWDQAQRLKNYYLPTIDSQAMK